MRPASAPSLKPNRHKNMHHKKSSSNRQKNRSTSRYGNAYTSFTNSMLAQRKFNELQSTGKFMTYNEMIKSVQKYSVINRNCEIHILTTKITTGFAL